MDLLLLVVYLCYCLELKRYCLTLLVWFLMLAARKLAGQWGPQGLAVCGAWQGEASCCYLLLHTQGSCAD
jgi:hypothetical protein